MDDTDCGTAVYSTLTGSTGYEPVPEVGPRTLWRILYDIAAYRPIVRR